MKIIRKIILVVICVILVDYIYQYNQFQKYNQAPLIIKRGRWCVPCTFLRPSPHTEAG